MLAWARSRLDWCPLGDCSRLNRCSQGLSKCSELVLTPIRQHFLVSSGPRVKHTLNHRPRSPGGKPPVPCSTYPGPLIFSCLSWTSIRILSVWGNSMNIGQNSICVKSVLGTDTFVAPCTIQKNVIKKTKKFLLTGLENRFSIELYEDMGEPSHKLRGGFPHEQTSHFVP